MKGKNIAVLVFFLASLTIGAVEAAQPYDASPYKMPGTFTLHQTAYGELREGEGESEIRLIGEQPMDARHNKRLFIEVIPPKGKGEVTLFPLQDDINGFDPQIRLANFIAQDKKEIFLTVSGADRTFKNKFYVLELLGDDESRFIYDSLALKTPQIKGNFQNGYRVRTLVVETGQQHFIDLSPRKNLYTSRGIFDAKTGKLRRQFTAWGGEFVSLEPADVDGDGIQELRGVMILYGTGPADSIAQVQSVLKYGSGGWSVMRSATQPARDLSFAKTTVAAKPKATVKKRIVKVNRATPTAKRPTTIQTTQ